MNYSDNTRIKFKRLLFSIESYCYNFTLVSANYQLPMSLIYFEVFNNILRVIQ